MAIFHFSMQVISRNSGRSACAAAAYRAATKIHDERTGQTHDYTRKRGVIDSAILAPNRAPEWAASHESLWNMAEAAERRKDAQVARENIIALPHELSLEENKAWLHAFVQEAYVKRGMAAQVDIHAPNREGSELNVHAHVLLSTRQLTRNGFKEKKARSWNEKKTLHEWRELCAHHMNQALERAGHDERVDHRSFEAQGVDKMPTQHLGPDASKMERRRGLKTRIGDENRKAKEYNRKMEQMKQELLLIDAAIAEERKRLEQKRSLEKSTQEVLATPSFASELDPIRDKEASDQRERLKLQSDLNSLYRRKQTEQELEASKALLEKSKDWLSRMTGRKAAIEEQIQSLERNLENIRQREAEAFGALEKRLKHDSKQHKAMDSEVPSSAPQHDLEHSRTGPQTQDKPSLSRDFNAPSNDNVPNPDKTKKQHPTKGTERQAKGRGRDPGNGLER